ncbi:MAG: ATP-binding protein [Acidobacteria bacterium]|nr:ATP-binding protein [Acidobacteriota bacterium]
MIVDSIYFKGHTCFKNEWSGFDTVKPINVIIGRNNSGKSHLLDLVEVMCSGRFDESGWQFRCRGVLDRTSLQRAFPPGTENLSGPLPGNRWQQYGERLVNVEITWETNDRGKCREVSIPESAVSTLRLGEEATNALIVELGKGIHDKKHDLTGRSFRRLLADRDIATESSTKHLSLAPNGRGASNLVRRYITSSSEKLSRDIIQRDLLSALNVIFEPDGRFAEIQIQEHDDKDTDSTADNHWEIHLGEAHKDLVPLSESGSGLKTVLLVLLNLLVMPDVDDKEKSQFVFAFEELENNLHPALLRRLFRYIEDYAVTEQATFFLTTHSSTALDFFGTLEHAQIVHVIHDGESAHAAPVPTHFERLGVVSELGARPSDLLQANGIVWLEGPSDRVYLNRWIELCSDDRLREGRDYQCAFYGGALLARAQFTPPDEADEELANLLQVNPNVVIVCDSDRSFRPDTLKQRVRRIREEVERIPGGHIWVTRAREIENYLPAGVLEQALGESSLPDPGQFESFFPRKRARLKTYIEAHLKRRHLDKMELASLSVAHMTRKLMESRFDWNQQMAKIVERIESWNG